MTTQDERIFMSKRMGSRPLALFRNCIAMLLLLLVVDGSVMDRWQVRGKLADFHSGQGISEAWILADFEGDKPLINPPVPPHPNNRVTYCMGARLIKTDANGRFSFDEFTWNRVSANKNAFLHVFKPGWLAISQSVPMTSSVFGFPTTASLFMSKGPGEKANPGNKVGVGLESQLPTNQFFSTSELLETLGVIENQTCGVAGTKLSKLALDHALTIATTYDERARVRAACKYMQNYSATDLPKRISIAEKFTSGYPKRDWPFDCDNLQFKNPVPPNVLRVEAEVAAERRARITASNQGS